MDQFEVVRLDKEWKLKKFLRQHDLDPTESDVFVEIGWAELKKQDKENIPCSDVILMNKVKMIWQITL